uniref:Uncharacterized protein n=1 Tax=Chromera velia CCMP2878 TaxID=1169474 RepID=A0A0G4GJC2_9ALVE|eukprot:Cvel_4788.t1-p1 / transcript=Cvel_4788.t1 / gene=Cvel_4788 / organism=Chromera_velia_CCMP2878 / gene_product=hypothetical protein / transcript_product=hypothetical protein / location=Cvel_scaffold214:14448-15428(+) / protein_length=327 / sequence_SO=supercontig / SO=protein_coding / is_pseudo=false
MSKYVTLSEDATASRLVEQSQTKRATVLQLRYFPVLSADWLRLLPVAEELSGAMASEMFDLSSLNKMKIDGRHQKGTLWDQETKTQEEVIKIVVEEAKANLCLRLLSDLKSWQRTHGEEAFVSEASKEMHKSKEETAELLRSFEENLGLILSKCLSYVEALQLCELPALFKHASVVFSHTQEDKRRAEALAKDRRQLRSQEFAALLYISKVFEHVEELNDTQIVQQIIDMDLLRLFGYQVLLFVSPDRPLKPTVALPLLKGLEGLLASEEFRTHSQPGGAFSAEEVTDVLLRLHSEVAVPLVQSDRSMKGKTRQLGDFALRHKKRSS